MLEPMRRKGGGAVKKETYLLVNAISLLFLFCIIPLLVCSVVALICSLGVTIIMQ